MTLFFTHLLTAMFAASVGYLACAMLMAGKRADERTRKFWENESLTVEHTARRAEGS